MQLDEYFQSYNDLAVHKLMLQDQPRVNAYLQAFQQLKHAGKWQEAIVLDVGAGTGVLSMLAATVGCKHVHAVEASPMAVMARTLVEHNCLQDKVTVYQCTAEEVELPEKVDFVISEWMGFYLLHENMLPSVIAARDKWMKPGGTMLPTRAAIYLSPVEMTNYYAKHVHCWGSMYGLDYSPVAQAAKELLPAEPVCTEVIGSDQLLSDKQLVGIIDCNTATAESLQHVSATLTFPFLRQGTLHGFCCWFDCDFAMDTAPEPLLLSTAPDAEPTHWKQTVFFLPDEFPVDPQSDDKGDITVTISLDAADSQRAYAVSLEIGGGEAEAEVRDLLLAEMQQ
eukprot:NODE_1724_length_1238_cov_71.102610_g1709_i0.p1 GENE.NODE_1724_length_1238_cov_71.102610_g1709_i0~~NODE_1724_length_1238_cov_71.102610_g1709_i0.p1  ORF type:complete len:338 (+),score=60.42 NODE_1724_length_1238_cov_71.102610_g1709_i0:88-1101(+)